MHCDGFARPTGGWIDELPSREKRHVCFANFIGLGEHLGVVGKQISDDSKKSEEVAGYCIISHCRLPISQWGS